MVTMATGAASTSAAGGRKGGREDGRGLDGAFFPGSGALRSPFCAAAAWGGVVLWPAQFFVLPAEGQERALVGGAEGCSDLDPA